MSHTTKKIHSRRIPTAKRTMRYMNNADLDEAAHSSLGVFAKEASAELRRRAKRQMERAK